MRKRRDARRGNPEDQTADCRRKAVIVAACPRRSNGIIILYAPLMQAKLGLNANIAI
jgi:hypothetical protein